MADAGAAARARWSKAAARAEGLADLGIAGSIRRFYLFHFPLTVLIALGVAFILAFLWPPDPASFLITGLSFGLMLAGIASCVVGFVYGSKRIGPLVQPQRIGVTVGLTADEVKRVRRQVLGKEPVDADLTVLRGAAVQIREGLARQLVTLPPLMLFFWGQALNRGVTSAFDVVMLIVLLGMMVILGFTVRQFRQTEAFLRVTVGSSSDDPM